MTPANEPSLILHQLLEHFYSPKKGTLFFGLKEDVSLPSSLVSAIEAYQSTTPTPRSRSTLPMREPHPPQITIPEQAILLMFTKLTEHTAQMLQDLDHDPQTIREDLTQILSEVLSPASALSPDPSPTPDPDLDFPPPTPNQWQCQSCGHTFTSPWPLDRAKFYANPRPKPCPRCKSIDASPKGF